MPPRKRSRPARPRGGARRRSRSPLAWLGFALAGAVLVAIGFWLGGRSLELPSIRPPAAKRDAAPPARARTGSSTRGSSDPAPATAAPGHAVRLALVIDDLGRSLEEIERLRALDVPLSYAVLPYETMTPEVLAALAAAHAEVLCHLPMEPKGRQNPGRGALVEGMDPAALAVAAERAIVAVPGATGVNNHMGSRISEDPAAMTAILEVVKRRGLFFLDSRTTSGTVAFDLARRAGIPAARRQVFLDPEIDREKIRAEVARWVELARRDGAAIAIGHPHPATLDVLAEEIPRARATGIEFVPVSYLLERGEELPE